MTTPNCPECRAPLEYLRAEDTEETAKEFRLDDSGRGYYSPLSGIDVGTSYICPNCYEPVAGDEEEAERLLNVNDADGEESDRSDRWVPRQQATPPDRP